MRLYIGLLPFTLSLLPRYLPAARNATVTPKLLALLLDSASPH